MSRQLELDINRPSWADTDFRTEVKDLWSVRDNKAANNEVELTTSLNEKKEGYVTRYVKTAYAKET